MLWRVRALTNDIAGTGTAETSGKPARTLSEEVRGRGGDVASPVKASDGDDRRFARKDAVVTPRGLLSPCMLGDSRWEGAGPLP